jgi:1-acyl-sn-glycerol-3-phosphate acyltransferase
MAREVFRAILIDRKPAAPDHQLQHAQAAIQQMVDGIGTTGSLIFFPEGTRGDGQVIAPFRAGLYHLALARPDIELVPVYLENLSRILPKGEVLPVPLIGLLTFGCPIHLQPGEPKADFLARAREAIVSLGRKQSQA